MKNAASTVSSPVKEQRERSGVQSLERAFAILEIISSHPTGISLAELSKQVGLHNSTAHHLVRTMVDLGYIRQDRLSKRYQAGRKIFALAANARHEIDFVALAEPILSGLSARTGESAHLAVFAGNEVVVIARSAGSGAFQLRESYGGSRPGHATALGKVLLAALDDTALEAYLKTHGMERLTDKTIVEPDRLTEELQQVRKTGIAYDDGEFNAEVRCVASAVHDFTGNVAAAIGLSGPVWRLTLQALHRYTSEVDRSAKALSAELGA